jgi:hypothetical protein
VSSITVLNRWLVKRYIISGKRERERKNDELPLLGSYPSRAMKQYGQLCVGVILLDSFCFYFSDVFIWTTGTPWKKVRLFSRRLEPFSLSLAGHIQKVSRHCPDWRRETARTNIYLPPSIVRKKE